MKHYDYIEKAQENYWEIKNKLENLNGITLEELPDYLGVTITQWDEVNREFDFEYGNIQSTIWQVNSDGNWIDSFRVSEVVPVYDDKGYYIRDLEDDEL